MYSWFNNGASKIVQVLHLKDPCEPRMTLLDVKPVILIGGKVVFLCRISRKRIEVGFLFRKWKLGKIYVFEKA